MGECPECNNKADRANKTAEKDAFLVYRDIVFKAAAHLENDEKRHKRDEVAVKGNLDDVIPLIEQMFGKCRHDGEQKIRR